MKRLLALSLMLSLFTIGNNAAAGPFGVKMGDPLPFDGNEVKYRLLRAKDSSPYPCILLVGTRETGVCGVLGFGSSDVLRYSMAFEKSLRDNTYAGMTTEESRKKSKSSLKCMAAFSSIKRRQVGGYHRSTESYIDYLDREQELTRLYGDTATEHDAHKGSNHIPGVVAYAHWSPNRNLENIKDVRLILTERDMSLMYLFVNADECDKAIPDDPRPHPTMLYLFGLLKERENIVLQCAFSKPSTSKDKDLHMGADKADPTP